MSQAPPKTTPLITSAHGKPDCPDDPGHPAVIMVIEDEPVLLSLARMVLEGSGFQVVEAASGEVALELWQEWRERIDLVLTDMIMPGGLSGSQVVQKMRVDCPDLKIIYSSGYSLESMHETTGETDEASFLSKPYMPSDLIDAVRRRLNRAAQ